MCDFSKKKNAKNQKRASVLYSLHCSPSAAIPKSIINPSFPPQYFNGSQLLSLYNVQPVIPKNASTKKIKIAIVIAYSYRGLLKDLKTYWQNSINFGPNSTPPTVNVYTMPGATFNESWAQEECLDVQMVCTINPNANIWVVEAKSNTLEDLTAAVDYASNILKADVISMSWGCGEDPSLTTFNKCFANASISYCAASGDNNYVTWPSTLSNCISVGGTTLLWTPQSSTPRTEFAWPGAGCGYSSMFEQPGYQSNISTIQRKYRVTPDVSLIANSNSCVYSVYNGSWIGVGGTSVATPIFAAMLSLANQMRFNTGKSALTTVYSNTTTPANNIQNYLYKVIYPGPKYKTDFNDITVGSNEGSVGGVSTSLTTYNTSLNWDIPTGLGSPNCANLCNDLALL